MMKNKGLKLIAAFALIVLMLGSVACGRLVWVSDSSTEQPSNQTEAPIVPENDTQEPEKETPEPESPIKKNGKAVSSAEQLSMYDIVTFGSYVQSEMGSETPIEWIVIKISGNKVRLMSKYCLDSHRYHSKKDEMVEFKDSELYRWLNKEFKKDAFSEEERQMLTDGITLLDRTEVMKLPKEYRKATATEYAIEVSDFNVKKDFWWLGESCEDPVDEWNEETWDYEDCYCAYAMKGDGTDIWSFAMTFHGKGVRPVVTIQF